MSDRLVIDPGLIRKYGGPGPRYTSYPTADRFVEAFDASVYRGWLENRAHGGPLRTLSLYVHLPFCRSLCYYCACNKIVTKNRTRADDYLERLGREIGQVAGALGGGRTAVAMHWGGGTPTWFDDQALARLMRMIRAAFDLDPAGEYAIEVDPRGLGPERIARLAALGMNRISFGVQDFDAEVQQAVHRRQSVEETEAVIRAARESGFRSVNVDLIYGLPRQTPQGFARTLEQVLRCDPDRIALYGYAHLPQIFKPQRRIAESDLPHPETKLEIFTGAVAQLQAAGYVAIGMDHFAKPHDDLAVAQRQGRLTRNFQGYSSGGDCDIVGFGASAISQIGPIYAQNAKSLDDYYARLDRGVLPTARGIVLNADDLARRTVIQSLMCHFAVSKEAIAVAHLLDFDRYFASELARLAEMAREGLVELEKDWITVTARGRLLVRAIASVFDRYLGGAPSRALYSRVA